MSTDDARGLERPSALTALRRFAEAQAVTARSLGREQTERGWLDALALLDQADKQAARLIEQREAAARAEGAAAEAAKFAGEWNRMFEAGRAEGRREVREAVERLADEFESEVDWSAGRWDYGDNAAWTSAAERIRAVLAGQGGESGEGA